MESAPLPPFSDESLPQPEVAEDSNARTQKNETKPSVEMAVQEGEFVTHAVEKRPEAVLPHVIAAAEQDKPQEAVYELRHEVKDDKKVTPMVPIASVVADIPKRQPAMAGLKPPPFMPVIPSSELPSTTKKPLSPVHIKSITLGFSAAVVILIIAYALYLVTS